MRRFPLDAALLATAVIALPALAQAEDPDPAYVEKGKASFYDSDFQGKKTTSGEKFDQAQPTAAHPDLPLGTEVTVKNPENGKEVEVEINDRGPHAKGRAIDLSKAAAKEIGIDSKEGVAPVEIEATKAQIEEGKHDELGPKEKEAKADPINDGKNEAKAGGKSKADAGAKGDGKGKDEAMPKKKVAQQP